MPPINPERWRVLSPYLDQALEIAADDRAAWLGALSIRDAALAADLGSILAQQDRVRDSRFLERAVLQPTPMTSLSGQVIGAYRLISRLGQGGTGTVWLAERCDGRFEGRAAVKLLNISLVGRVGEQRFRREGNILARLRHPRIAHLIDAGVSPSGQPYLVLEHVDGQSIDQYCDERSLSIEARLRLFLEVLDAVAHAHANLIVHRDIKPANVLVSTEGEVKLLDFGIAKLIERESAWGSTTTTAGLTRDGGAALTPEYAAPEQLSGGGVTTATDIYALGVLLYLLLSGRHPVQGAGSPAALIKAVLETEPPPPSVAQSPMQGKLSRALRVDLDTIVAKAMKKNPAERYASVTAMADDLRRVLRHQPITARPDTLRYRTARFVRRHSVGVALAAGGTVLLAGLVTLHTYRLAAERDHAQREAAKALKVSQMLTGLLTSADPYTVRGTGGEPTVRALLDAGARRVQVEFAADPDLQAQLLSTMGRTYRRLGLYDNAQHLLEQALVSAHKAFGAEHVTIAQTLQYLGVVLADEADFAGAARRLEQALAMQRRLLGSQHGDIAVTLSELGRVYQDEGLNQRAEPLHREALEMRRRMLGDRDRETAVSLSDLASVLRVNGDLSGAERLLQESLAINRETRGENHPNTATNLHDLALIAQTRGNHRAAEPMLRKALAIERQALGDRHSVVAATYNSLSHVLVDQRRYDEAASSEQSALHIAGAALGPDHPLVAIYSINLAAVQLARGTPAALADAELLLRDGLRIRSLAPGVVPARRRTLPQDDWSPAAVQALLDSVLLAEQHGRARK